MDTERSVPRDPQFSGDQVVQAVQSTRGPISVGGGRFSMGGQTASPGAMQIDMRGMNRALAFCSGDRRIRVESGIRWCDIQRGLYSLASRGQR